jgi:urease accessory protein
VWLTISVVVVGAAFHGYAHGLEKPAAAVSSTYIVGFALGAALIAATGALLGDIAGHYKSGRLGLGLVGGAVGAVGIMMIAGVL